MLLLNRDIQVFVLPGLFAEERINAPPSIDPNFNADIGHRFVEIKHVVCDHSLTVPRNVHSQTLGNRARWWFKSW